MKLPFTVVLRLAEGVDHEFKVRAEDEDEAEDLASDLLLAKFPGRAMTYQILKATPDAGPELDDRIAERVMGLEIPRVHAGGGPVTAPPFPIPRYSTNRDAGYQVLMKMLEKPEDVQDRFFHLINFVATKILDRTQDTKVWYDTFDPHFVCVAALMAVEGK